MAQPAKLSEAADAAAPIPQGLPARAVAAEAFERTLAGRLQLDDVLDQELAKAGLGGRDGALARAIANVAFRHLGTISRALEARLEHGAASLPRPVQAILATAAGQVLFLDAADHAAVDIAVQLTKRQRLGMKFAGLANAVLRGVARDADRIRSAMAPLGDDVPAWLSASWTAAYGETAAREIAAALSQEIALDITVREDAAGWAEKLGGFVLASGSVRLLHRDPVETLLGYGEGAWWVQDAASAIPARLLRAAPGERVADLCAAPGGKTAQLAAAGARVTAVDRSAQRLAMLESNMARLGLEVDVRVADAGAYAAEPFDAILLDAPCSATGTIRRHPEVMWTKRPDDEARLAALQARLLDHAVSLLKPGGRLVYCTCSLQAAEGEDQVAALLARRNDVRLDPVMPDEIGVEGALTARGEFRALPHQMPHAEPRLSGWGGFYAARLVRS
jgi:16S rRNA (cytosine967-C5)-methyltransferase